MFSYEVVDTRGSTISDVQSVFIKVLGNTYELTSHRGGALEIYKLDTSDGIYMYQGGLSVFTGEEIRATFRAAWNLFFYEEKITGGFGSPRVSHFVFRLESAAVGSAVVTV